MYVCMYTCSLYAYVYVCMGVRTPNVFCRHVSLYVYVYVCMCAYMYMPECMPPIMYVCMYDCKYILQAVCRDVCLYVCQAVCLSVCLSLPMSAYLAACMYLYDVCLFLYVCMYAIVHGCMACTLCL